MQVCYALNASIGASGFGGGGAARSVVTLSSAGQHSQIERDAHAHEVKDLFVGAPRNLQVLFSGKCGEANEWQVLFRLGRLACSLYEGSGSFGSGRP